jgi:hypothetical protein
LASISNKSTTLNQTEKEGIMKAINLKLIAHERQIKALANMAKQHHAVQAALIQAELITQDDSGPLGSVLASLYESLKQIDPAGSQASQIEAADSTADAEVILKNSNFRIFFKWDHLTWADNFVRTHPTAKRILIVGTVGAGKTLIKNTLKTEYGDLHQVDIETMMSLDEIYGGKLDYDVVICLRSADKQRSLAIFASLKISDFDVAGIHPQELHVLDRSGVIFSKSHVPTTFSFAGFPAQRYTGLQG